MPTNISEWFNFIVYHAATFLSEYIIAIVLIVLCVVVSKRNGFKFLPFVIAIALPVYPVIVTIQRSGWDGMISTYLSVSSVLYIMLVYGAQWYRRRHFNGKS
jgi:hypothetical protein